MIKQNRYFMKRDEIGIVATKKIKNKLIKIGKEFDGFHYYWYVKAGSKEHIFPSKQEAIRYYERVKK